MTILFIVYVADSPYGVLRCWLKNVKNELNKQGTMTSLLRYYDDDVNNIHDSHETLLDLLLFLRIIKSRAVSGIYKPEISSVFSSGG